MQFTTTSRPNGIKQRRQLPLVFEIADDQQLFAKLGDEELANADLGLYRIPVITVSGKTRNMAFPSKPVAPMTRILMPIKSSSQKDVEPDNPCRAEQSRDSSNDF